MPNRLMIIGLDGGTWKIIDRYAAEGVLPNIRKLIDRGARAVMTSTIPPVTPVAWSSMTTGTNPGMHGILSWVGMERIIDGEVRLVPCNGSGVCQPRLWDFLSAAGQRVCVVNVPLTWPPAQVNGTVISGMDTPDETTNYTFPAEFKEELKAAGIDYQVDYDTQLDEGAGRHSLDVLLERIAGEGKWFFDRAESVTAERMKAIRLLLKRPWDFFMAVFVGMDRIQHVFWHYMLPEALPEDPHAAKIHARIRNCYRQLDEAVGEMVDAAGADTIICLVSDHGFCQGRGDFYLNTWLRDHGWLRTSTKTVMGKLGVLARKLGLTRIAMRRVVGVGAASKLSAIARGVDWAQTRAYFFNSWAVRLNLKGREHYGIIQPGAEFEHLRDRLAEELLEARDPDRNKLFCAAHKREDLFHGPYAAEAGDLILEASPGCGFTCYSKEFYKPGVPRKGDEKQRGTHDLDGIFLLSGPGIKQDRSMARCSILDVVPTALHLMGQPRPAHLEGRVVDELLVVPSSADLSTAAAQAMEKTLAERTSAYSEDERMAVEARLRHLGYLD